MQYPSNNNYNNHNNNRHGNNNLHSNNRRQKYLGRKLKLPNLHL